MLVISSHWVKNYKYLILNGKLRIRPAANTWFEFLAIRLSQRLAGYGWRLVRECAWSACALLRLYRVLQDQRLHTLVAGADFKGRLAGFNHHH